MAKSDNKSQALGDDPLAWLNKGNEQAKKKPAAKKKMSKKAKPEKAKPEKAKSEKVKPNKEKSQKEAKPKAENKSASNKVVLESSMVINKAAAFYETLKETAANGQAVEIDASEVEIIDSAILQLLFAFVLKLKENDIKLSWHKPTEGLLNKATILGLREPLGL